MKQISDIEHIVPNSYHLTFPEIFDKLKKEIKSQVSSFNYKKIIHLLSDRDVGKTFASCLYLANMLMKVPTGYKVAIYGVQMIHAKNLLVTVSAIMDMYGQKIDVKKMIKCYPGKGESFRGNNNVKFVVLDESFNYKNLEFLTNKM